MRYLVRHVLALLGLAAVLPLAAFAQADDPASRIDAVFAEYAKKDSPGCAVALVKDGLLRYGRGYGMASLELAVPIKPDTVFDIGSTSKQITAASILLLVQDGKLALDDDVRKHIPELPDYGTKITVGHLLHHTSGIRDYINLLAMSGVNFVDVATDGDALGILARQKALDFPPGSEHSYSNSGYFLLSLIVRRVSGKPLADFAKERIFEPLGMTSTLILTDHTRVVPGRATAYSPRPEGGFGVDVSAWEQTGDGAVNTTVLDLVKWDANFYDPKVGGTWLIEQLETVGTLNDGSKIDYARGLVIDRYRGLRRVQHGGGWAGYRAQMMRFPEQKVTSIVLCNVGSANTTRLAESAAEVYLTGLAPEEEAAAAPPKAVQLKDLKRYAGLYWSPALDFVRTLEVRDGKLFYQRGPGNETELAPTAEGRFAMLGVPNLTEVIFQPAEAGKRTFHVLAAGDSKPAVFQEVQPVTPKPEDLAAYTGTYSSEELDTAWRLLVQDGKLTVDLKRGRLHPLEPAFTDTFRSPIGLVRFSRDGQGQIISFYVGAGRARNILFRRNP